ncbi:hypothetical protein Pmani_000634 [Petrolisthes manimaculis]|uniref:NACHT domain-containing protein n=1 Tax=Petrolisthes manimaculis TaxID=1843537 RepID=A0AAE1UL42_9EUCA|nr:hypothetical protein Pmani_000634 [Petrolisthes manimaculis]
MIVKQDGDMATARQWTQTMNIANTVQFRGQNQIQAQGNKMHYMNVGDAEFQRGVVMESSSGADTPPAKVKRKRTYTQNYKKEWESDPNFRGWLSNSVKGPEYFHCKACNTDGKAGKSEVEKHAEGKKHIQNIKAVKSTVSVLEMPSVSGKRKEKQVKEGELRLVSFLNQLNLPHSAITQLVQVVQAACPDSEISKEFRRYHHSMTTTERDELIKEIKDNLASIRDGNILYDLRRECHEELKTSLKMMLHFNPVSFILGSSLALDVTLIFTDIEIKHGTQRRACVVSYQDFLVEIHKVPGRRVVLLEGVAGSGKTTLITLMLQEWCGGQGTIKELDTYQVLLHVVCRDPSTNSYESLVQKSLPTTYIQFGNNTKPLLAQCRILVLIDGLDEATKASCDLTHSGRDTNQLVQLIQEKVKLEHFRIPLNLLLSAWVWDQDPDALGITTTQTELYYHTHRLSKMKLQQRLSNHQATCYMSQTTISDLIDEWEEVLCKELLVALSLNQLVLTPESVRRLRCEAKSRGLPDEEMLGGFLTLKVIKLGLQQYSAPHKGLQDYYAALHIVESLKKNHHLYIRKVLKYTLASSITDLKMYQNVLQHLAGLLHLHINPVPNHMVIEVVELLREAGVRNREQWLDLVEDTKASPAVLAAIASNALPFQGILSSISSIFSHPSINVMDGRVIAYSALLPYLTPTEVRVSIYGKQPNLTPLVDSLARHTYTIELWDLWYHPNPTYTPNASLQTLLSSSGMVTFKGQWTRGMESMSPSLRYLSLSLSDSTHVTQLVPLLHLLPRLKYLVPPPKVAPATADGIAHTDIHPPTQLASGQPERTSRLRDFSLQSSRTTGTTIS